MRVKERGAKSLVDIPLLQAERLGQTVFRDALERAKFDPFPDGSRSVGADARKGSFAQNSGSAAPELSGGALTSFDSALPDYMQDALQSGLHADDDGMKAFLALFDRRLMQLELRARKASVLVATQDRSGQNAASILNRLARAIKRDNGDPRYVQLMMPLLSRARTLEGLRDIVAWWIGRDVCVSASFNRMLPIDSDCRTRLTGSGGARHFANALGQGALLGRQGQTPVGRIALSIDCENDEALQSLADDQSGLNELRDIVTQYLRDPVPVTFFAQIRREYLKSPALSARAEGAGRLGAYHLLQPERRPELSSSIKLA
ncbi:type VI secretion system baseplate subunit TssG [Epibacterium ulvae]|uniref:type VI secretion system baseplate subunit TssG n=1 Tax=Epibacterium ulvae TaxID=1156985 RepID=UPI002490637A|nr:type VI secretion system baseplate subunit TssG [Epibacterium ulvae]